MALSTKFCPKCGKESVGLCKDCKTHELNLKEISVHFCVSCNRVQSKNKWFEIKDLETLYTKLLKESTKEPVELVGYQEIEKKPGIKKTINLLLQHNNEELEFPVYYEVTYCPNCKKKDSQYFEGILQFRGDNKEIIDFIKSDLKKHESKGVHCNNIIRIKQGYDFYITNKKYINRLGQRLVEQFGGECQANEQLFSRDKLRSKDLFRINMHYKQPEYLKGQIIIKDNSPIKIVNVSKKISGINLKNDTKVSFNYEEGLTTLKKQETTVSKDYPDYEILNPETFQNEKLITPHILKVGQKIKAVEHENVFYQA